MPFENLTRQIIVRFLIGITVISVVLFGSAGTFNWPEAWLCMIIQFSFSAAMTMWLKKHNPDLLRERMLFMKQTAKNWDKAIVLSSTLIFFPYLFLHGLDAVRYQWSSIPLIVKMVGYVGMLISFSLIFWVMRVNTYLWTTVEIQKDRGHRVITSGPYRYIRHPMYAGFIILYMCIPLSLGSFWSLIPGLILTGLIAVRTHWEDKVLHTELEGYKIYAEKVRYKLVPGIW